MDSRITEDKIKELEARGEVIYFNFPGIFKGVSLDPEEIKDIIYSKGRGSIRDYAHALVKGYIYQVLYSDGEKFLNKTREGSCENSEEGLINYILGKK